MSVSEVKGVEPRATLSSTHGREQQQRGNSPFLRISRVRSVSQFTGMPVSAEQENVVDFLVRVLLYERRLTSHHITFRTTTSTIINKITTKNSHPTPVVPHPQHPRWSRYRRTRCRKFLTSSLVSPTSSSKSSSNRF